MTRVRFVRASLYFGLVVATSGPIAAPAADYGPAAAVKSVRHDLPILLAAGLEYDHLVPATDWVVTDGMDALALWHAGKNRGIVALRRHMGRWWWRAATVSAAGVEGSWTEMTVPGNDVTGCGTGRNAPPSAAELFDGGYVSRTLAGQVSRRLPSPVRLTAIMLCDPSPNYTRSSSGGFAATFVHNDLCYNCSYLALSGGRPVNNQKATSNEESVYYSFSLAIDSADYSSRDDIASPPPRISFTDGSTLDIWFPYVLPSRVRYTLQIDGIDPKIASLGGTVKNNVVHFVLPWFTLKNGTPAKGAIFGHTH